MGYQHSPAARGISRLLWLPFALSVVLSDRRGFGKLALLFSFAKTTISYLQCPHQLLSATASEIVPTPDNKNVRSTYFTRSGPMLGVWGGCSGNRFAGTCVQRLAAVLPDVANLCSHPCAFLASHPNPPQACLSEKWAPDLFRIPPIPLSHAPQRKRRCGSFTDCARFGWHTNRQPRASFLLEATE